MRDLPPKAGLPTDTDWFSIHVPEEGDPVVCRASGAEFPYRSPESHIDVELPLIAA